MQKHLDDLFAGVGESQELFELKEELSTNIKEKISDYKAKGMEEEEAYKEAIISMGDLSGLVNDMRKIGQDKAKSSVYTTMTSKISTAGIIAGVLLILFGLLTSAMMYFMNVPGVSVTGPAIFIVADGALLTYSVLTKETVKRYAMNKIRAALYALAVGLILFALYTAAAAETATGEMFIAIGAFMFLFLAGIGLYLFLIFTGGHRWKQLN
ncbi:permease prefix domain 1-containing protein [Alteribacillus sp. JSM 102045]|uniref:permease prefix domain 1-containing protein n=1 Tax=Alteribacillus sp. JSM 102045 TaxID=1562101 RepID=UPI0035C038BE